MKIVHNYILYLIISLIISGFTLGQEEESSESNSDAYSFRNLSVDELKTKIFLTKQAISKLRDEISKLKEDNNNNDGNFQTTNPNNMKFLQKQSEDHLRVKENHLTIEDDIKKDEDLQSKVYGYFNKNPQHLELKDLEKEIKQTGYKEFEDLIQILDKHPEQISQEVNSHFHPAEKVVERVEQEPKEKKENVNLNDTSTKQAKFKQFENTAKNIEKKKDNGINLKSANNFPKIKIKNKKYPLSLNGPIDFNKAIY